MPADPFDLSGFEPENLPAPNTPVAAAALPPPDWLARLNEAQREAADHLDGPLLVLAGAGTGKTRVLVSRLAHILYRRLAWPSQILAVTFTNKAAREMRERVERLVGSAVEGLWLGTFHGIANRILRRHAELVGLKPNFTILDDDDQLRLLKQIIEAEGIDEKQLPPRNLKGQFDRWKDRGYTPAKIPDSETGFAEGRGAKLYRLYCERLLQLNACDFGDLLLHNLTLFREHDQVLQKYQHQFRYILVDEYQDTNVAQYLWLRLLAQKHRNICCVGDDDQCVPEGTRVTLANGRRRKIEALKPGDLVRSSFGAGVYGAGTVRKVHRRRFSGNLVQIETAAGMRLRTTPEHTHFADIILNESPQKHFTYLMHKKGFGYRLGTSQIYTNGHRHPVIGYQQRCLQEGGDAVWLIRPFANEADARELEHRLSLAYGITTFPFLARKGGSVNGLVHDQIRLDRLHKSLAETGRVDELMQDYGLDPDHPHYRPQGHPGRRRNLILILNAERRGDRTVHRIAMSGNDAEGLLKLQKLGFTCRLYKRNPKNWRYEQVLTDFSQVDAIRRKLAAEFDVNVVRKANILGKALTMRPASQIVPGMVLALGDGRHDIVTEVKQVSYRGNIFDIDVTPVHNFIAEGVVTHNSIYGWRGAEVGNILRFETDFPGAKIVRLERNYRSTPHILGAASGLIAKNESRLGKTLWTDINEGEKVIVQGVWDGDEEARLVAEEIETLERDKVSLNEIAILVRAGHQTRAFEECFMTVGLKYRVIGGLRFYERREIRDAIAYFRVLMQPDDDLAFERIVNLPKRGLGDSTMQIIHKAARAGGRSLVAALRDLLQTGEIKPRQRSTLRNLLADFDRWRGQAADLPHTEVAKIILEESGYMRMWQEDKSPEAPGRLENLNELIGALGEFENFAGFLDHVSLVMDTENDDNAEMVSLMTLHAAKGLEFDHVFLPGWEEELFPSRRSLEGNGVAGLEEERRLAYVGLTRARKRAQITFAANRRIYNQWTSSIPSRFIDELPPEHIEERKTAGLYSLNQRTGYAGSGFSESALGAGGYQGHSYNFAPKFPRGGGLIEGRARRVKDDDDFVQHSPDDAAFAIGDRVFHQKFGYGRIRDVEGNKLLIGFEKAGEKRVIASFVQKA